MARETISCACGDKTKLGTWCSLCLTSAISPTQSALITKECTSKAHTPSDTYCHVCRPWKLQEAAYELVTHANDVGVLLLSCDIDYDTIFLQIEKVARADVSITLHVDGKAAYSFYSFNDKGRYVREEHATRNELITRLTLFMVGREERRKARESAAQ